jgi:tRNA nucleotidyltransferase (CCA-adding enzyme)
MRSVVKLLDPWGGEADIALATVRAVGEAAERFAEDPLRLLRAARFVSQLGFRLDWNTEEAMAAESAVFSASATSASWPN